MAYLDDDSFFADDTYKLSEIPEKVDIPTLVRVTEGIYSVHDCSTFSQGDIIKIDGCETIEMVAAHFAVWANGCYQKHGDELFVPLSYKGRVRVCPIHGVGHKYTSVEQLVTHFPKFVKLGQSLSFTYKGECSSLQADDTLELLRLIGSEKTGVLALRVLQNNKSEVVLPKSLKGLFITQEIDVDYTVHDVMKFKMPQCVKFIGQDINLFTSKDIQEAASNLEHYDGYIMLSGRKKTRTVLVGHYKAMDKNPSSKFHRRSAVVLPMDNDDIANIEVQVPMYTDTADYEIFVLNHFSECNVNETVEGLLYIDFSKNPGVIFPQDLGDNPPVVPPRTDRGSTSTSSTPPARPPRPSKPTQQQGNTQSEGVNVRRAIPSYENHTGKLMTSRAASEPDSGVQRAVGSYDSKQTVKSTDLSKSIDMSKSTGPSKSTDMSKFTGPSKSTDMSKSTSPSKSTGPSKSPAAFAGKKPTHAVVPIQKETEEEGSEFVIGDIFVNFSEGMDNFDEQSEPDSGVAYMNTSDEKKKHVTVKGFMNKIKKTFHPKHCGSDKEQESSRPVSENADSGPVYDYVDEKTLIDARKRAEGQDPHHKTAVVQPFQQEGVKSPENRLEEYERPRATEVFRRLCAGESRPDHQDQQTRRRSLFWSQRRRSHKGTFFLE
ncbi:uncharacterized protein LOC121371783 [Gigantopelta aegis]|uniref:uncharacterized protein LOC121371783 n=1 Tax=Gigantopelta aegis TaxID=1735272 RepID=UPI001B88DDB0|nr:uncharacterized protein LOC121371783 [Gigantopelta aegis]